LKTDTPVLRNGSKGAEREPREW